ncbi:MAG: hypothetical protein R3B48_26655 [Kofleriaceae bacterium]
MTARRVVIGLAAFGALAAFGGCKQQKEAPPPSQSSLTEVEIRRGTDACAAYEAKVCALAKAHPERRELVTACDLAPASNDAMKTALGVAQHPESTRRDVLQAQDSFRKTLAYCIEESAKLTEP